MTRQHQSVVTGEMYGDMYMPRSRARLCKTLLLPLISPGIHLCLDELMRLRGSFDLRATNCFGIPMDGSGVGGKGSDGTKVIYFPA